MTGVRGAEEKRAAGFLYGRVHTHTYMQAESSIPPYFVTITAATMQTQTTGEIIQLRLTTTTTTVQT